VAENVNSANSLCQFFMF